MSWKIIKNAKNKMIKFLLPDTNQVVEADNIESAVAEAKKIKTKNKKNENTKKNSKKI